MQKDFQNWHQLKTRLNDFDSKVLFKEREIWWCSVGCNLGFETDGKGVKFARPVLVYTKLSSRGFLGFPLTTREKNGSWYVPITIQGKLQIVNLSQIRFFDSKRILNKLATLDDQDWFEVNQSFCNLIKK